MTVVEEGHKKGRKKAQKQEGRDRQRRVGGGRRVLESFLTELFSSMISERTEDGRESLLI